MVRWGVHRAREREHGAHLTSPYLNNIYQHVRNMRGRGDGRSHAAVGLCPASTCVGAAPRATCLYSPRADKAIYHTPHIFTHLGIDRGRRRYRPRGWGEGRQAQALSTGGAEMAFSLTPTAMRADTVRLDTRTLCHLALLSVLANLIL